MEMLNNYYALVARVDELTRAVTEKYADHIVCKKGCDGCCRHISVSVVEGIAIAAALAQLPKERIAMLRDWAASADEGSPCPLLDQGECALYAHRPIICRTHGLPILIEQEGTQRVDYCPMNFQKVDALSGDAVIAVDRLNTILAAINKLFAAQYDQGDFSEDGRLTISQALLLEL